MTWAEIEVAINIRAKVEILKGAGMAEGRKGFLRGYNTAYGTVKVGLVDAAGNYTGTSIPCNPNYVRLTGGSIIHS
jgi:hypothetical protein